MDPEGIRGQIVSQNISLTPEALDTLFNASLAVNKVCVAAPDVFYFLFFNDRSREFGSSKREGEVMLCLLEIQPCSSLTQEYWLDL